MKRIFNHTKRPVPDYNPSDYEWDEVQDAEYDTEDQQAEDVVDAEPDGDAGTIGYYNEDGECVETTGYYNEEGEWVEATGYYNEEGEWVEATGYYNEEGEWVEAAGYYNEEGEWVEATGYYNEEGEWVEATGYYNEEGEWVETTGYYTEEGERVEAAGYYSEEGEWVETTGYYNEEDEWVENASYDSEDSDEATEEYIETEPEEAEVYEKDEAYTLAEEDEDRNPGILAVLAKKFSGVNVIDYVIAITGIFVVVLVLVIGGVFISHNLAQNESDFVEVGRQLDDIELVGEEGLLAIGQATLNRVQAEIAEQERLEQERLEQEQEKENEGYQENEYNKSVSVSFTLTSVLKDLKVKITNKSTKKLISSVPFAITVTDEDGNVQTWEDDDRDGIIYKNSLQPGNYKVKMVAFEDEKYSQYSVPTGAQSVIVKKDIAYTKVDVTDEIKSESEIDSSKEDTKKNETVTESVLPDTVTWVESTVTGSTYIEVPKSSIEEPTKLLLSGHFAKTALPSLLTAPVTPDSDVLDIIASSSTSDAVVDSSSNDDSADNSSEIGSSVLSSSESNNEPSNNAPSSEPSSGESSSSEASSSEPSSSEPSSSESSSSEPSSSESSSSEPSSSEPSSSEPSSSEPSSSEPSSSEPSSSEPSSSEPSSSEPSSSEPSSSEPSSSEPSSSEPSSSEPSSSEPSSSEPSSSVPGSSEPSSSEPGSSEPSSSEPSSTPSTEPEVPALKPIAAINLTPETVTIYVDNTSGQPKVASVKAQATGQTADKAIEYKIDTYSSELVDASINASTGEVGIIGKKAGKATIVVSANYKENGTAETKKTATITVKVVAAPTLKLDQTQVVVYMTEPVTLTATITDGAVSNPVITSANSANNGYLKASQSSSNPNAIILEGVSEGTTQVVVTYKQGDVTLEVACAVTVKSHPKNDKTTPLVDKSQQVIYVYEGEKYREATYADYYTATKFFIKGEPKYTGWQTLEGKVYFFTTEGKKVTGEQVIQGAKYNFASDGSLITGNGTLGIDVSKWNGTIDWTAVKNSGVSYVIIRCGYRGSSQGSLIRDPKFEENIKGATAAGLKVGVYFFSQAINEVEAVEEASMVLECIKNHTISYPVFLDVEASGGRADSLDTATRTAVIKTFCETIKNANYTPGVYANKNWLTTKINAGELNAYKIWLAQYAATPTYTGKFDMWQYKDTGKVSGISGNVDLNISYLGY